MREESGKGWWDPQLIDAFIALAQDGLRGEPERRGTPAAPASGGPPRGPAA
jgi:hypothetical protein